MNGGAYETFVRRLAFRLKLSLRWFTPRPMLRAFGSDSVAGARRIQQIFVINLDRQQVRWRRMQRELARIRANGGEPLITLTTRFPAIDAKITPDVAAGLVESVYSLSEQLFVAPEPLLTGSGSAEKRNIKMTRPEIAVARSHIETWKRIAASACDYGMVLEDDVYLDYEAPELIDRAWADLQALSEGSSALDMPYFSFREAGPSTEKQFVTGAVFKPVRGLWQMSGYVLSRAGAQKLLDLMPVRGPVDLWVNYQFEKINVFATTRSVIKQRPDAGSDNAYSILPVLSTAGVLREKPNLFRRRPLPGPIFALSVSGRGAGALAMALSMLGYRCCSGVAVLPEPDHKALLRGRRSRIFHAYVDVEAIVADLERMVRSNSTARLIIVGDGGRLIARGDKASVSGDQETCTSRVTPKRSVPDPRSWVAALGLGQDKLLVLDGAGQDRWKLLCSFLNCDRPEASYPSDDAHLPGLFAATHARTSAHTLPKSRRLKFDVSPWIVPSKCGWQGGQVPEPSQHLSSLTAATLCDKFVALDPTIWEPLTDTFPGNRALFAAKNLSLCGDGLRMTFREQPNQVRDYTSGSVRSVTSYLYGHFEAELRPARCPGLITGLFLHRYFPRQEIDIELLGRDTTKLLINVYYNPGDDGADLNYGHRGTPVLIDLGFDASEHFHRYAIEWKPTGIKWFVDGRLVYERGSWDPTPVPHLAMQFFVNLWSADSEELAGRLARPMSPAHSDIRSINLIANLTNSSSQSLAC